MIEYAKKLGKNIWLAASIGVIVAGGFLIQFNEDGTVTFCDPQGDCVVFTDKEYKDEFKRLRDLVNTNNPLSYEEYELFVRMYDKEIKRAGGINIFDVNLAKRNGTENISKMEVRLGLDVIQD